MGILSISLLGPPTVQWDGQPINLKRRLVRGLLFYLAAQKGEISRSNLIFTFWPDEPDEDARRHLRETLGRLRSDLPDPSLLLVTRDQVNLDRQRVVVDVHQFQELNDNINRIINQTPRHIPLPHAVYLDLVKSVELWRSPQYFASRNTPTSIEFDNWISQTAQHLESDRLYLIERLADHTAVTGDLEAALHWAYLGLQGDETNIYLNYRILGWFHTLGRRSEALAQVEVVKNLLIAAGEEMPLEIKTLIDRVSAAAKSRQTVEFPWIVDLNTHIPFVGREMELNQLRMQFQRGGAVAILGESGSGKTRLVYELFQSILPHPRLFRATPYPLERSIPFQSLIDSLRTSISTEEWLKLDPIWVTQLTHLLPELHNLRPDVPTPTHPVGERNRGLILEALRQLLLSISSSGRLLFFLDDAQWCDEATLSAISYLLERSFFDEHGFLVIARRIETANPSLDTLHSRSRGQGVISHINLTLLNADQVASLVYTMLGKAPSLDLVDRLVKDTGGNPLFLIETLQELTKVSPNLDFHQPVDRLPLAESLRALVHNRLQNLQPVEYHLLSIAAVLGSEFNPQLIAVIAAEDIQAILSVMDVLEKAHLIQPASDSQSDSYNFVHDKLREALLLELGASRRRQLHLQIARSLEKDFPLSQTSQAAILAQHFEAAHEDHCAFQHWIKAAEYATSLFSPANALEAYHHAEKILNRPAFLSSDDEIYALYSSWGEMALNMHDAAAAHKIYSSLLEISEKRHSPFLMGVAFSGLGGAQAAVNNNTEAEESFRRALHYLEETENVYEKMACHQRKGEMLMYSHRYPEAMKAFKHSFALGKSSSSGHILEARLNTQLNLAYILSAMGWVGRAERSANQCLRTSLTMNYTDGILRSYAVLARANYFLGRNETALEEARMGLSLAEATQSKFVGAFLHGETARLLQNLGQLDDAWVHAQTALRMGADVSSMDVHRIACSALGDIYGSLGDFSRALENYRSGIQNPSPGFSCAENQLRYAFHLSFAGNLNEAETHLRELITASRNKGFGTLYLIAEMALAIVLAREGHCSEALQLLKTTFPEIQKRKISRFRTYNDTALFHIALQENRIADAQRHALQLGEYCRSISNPFMELYAYDLLQSANKLSDQPIPLAVDRISQLLDFLDRNVTHPELRPSFLARREAFLNTIRIKLD